LTAHVNFSAIRKIGEDAGLITSNFTRRPSSDGNPGGGCEKTIPSANGTIPAHGQFQTLTHPEHLGRAFRVLVQTR